MNIGLTRPHTGAVLPVSERFGPTIQGEGPAAGRAAWFIRLGGCNLSCSWCDSAWTWDASRYRLREENPDTSVQDVAGEIPSGSMVVLTGGEPLLHQGQDAWRELLATLTAKGCELHVETNGTINPDDETCSQITLFVVSPKLANAGTHRGHQNPELHPGWADVAARAQAHLKVVCETADDVRAAVRLGIGAGFPLRQIWVMPEGVTVDTLAARWPIVAEAAAELGVNATHRLHILAWSDKRGH